MTDTADVAPNARPLVKRRAFARRGFLRAALLSVPLLAVADALWLEPKCLKIRRVRLGDRNSTHRVTR